MVVSSITPLQCNRMCLITARIIFGSFHRKFFFVHANCAISQCWTTWASKQDRDTDCMGMMLPFISIHHQSSRGCTLYTDNSYFRSFWTSCCCFPLWFEKTLEGSYSKWSDKQPKRTKKSTFDVLLASTEIDCAPMQFIILYICRMWMC